jgi:hypothetical protein
LVIVFAPTERPIALDKIISEIITVDATLTIDRQIPVITNIVTNIG